MAAAPVVFLLGPTAIGKTRLVLALGRRAPIEIVSVDSGLIYRRMDIGTAKPDANERAAVPHHLIDIRDPHQRYSAAEFVDDAIDCIAAIRARGAVPVLTGGTMLYFKALDEGLADLPAADPDIRQRLVDEARTCGWQALHDRLAICDPAAAARIHPNDPQRLQRALEVYELTGTPLSTLQARTGSRLVGPRVKCVMLPPTRAWLHARIERRLALMWAGGLLEEVRGLLRDPRLDGSSPSMRSVGYRQARAHLLGEITGRAMQDQALAATRQLAKRQLTWIRGMSDLLALPCEHDAALAQLASLCQCPSP